MASMQTIVKYAVGISFAAVVIGCQQGPLRIGVSGTVTYKGAKIADGWVTFVPKDADKGTQEAARITDGKYELPSANGLMPGEYRVAITAHDPAAKPTAGEVPGAPRRGNPRIPEEYNRNTDLGIEVSAEGKREFHFNLE
jgi:hypothetical protein